MRRSEPLRRAVAPAGMDVAEWLVPNGLGGFASGTVLGPPSRRYHGLLVAALAPPVGRMVLLAQLRETLDGAAVVPTGFEVEDGLPVWRCEAGGAVLEKRVFMPRFRNTVHVAYRLVEGGPVTLKLEPVVPFRRLESQLAEAVPAFDVVASAEGCVLHDSGDAATLRLVAPGMRFSHQPLAVTGLFHAIEAARGYDATGVAWSPGAYTATLGAGQGVTFTASAEAQHEPPEEVLAAELERRGDLLRQAGVGSGLAAELVLAADQFIIAPPTRLEESAGEGAEGKGNAAAGELHRTVIAGYHWFTDWGRDTMISLEGLTLATGRHEEGGAILRTFAKYIRDGLIPNMFPDGKLEGLYHTADATLWFFHAVHRYVQATGDRDTLRALLPRLVGILDHHLRGTRFGIGVDPSDGLLRQGEEGYQLTWMDAKVDGWVVTPRRGKAVEINALWYNALRLTEAWLGAEGDSGGAGRLGALARQAQASFNARFWNPATGHLFDVVDADDPACRPNQIFALSLDHPVLEPSRWPAVLDAVTAKLLTPMGLRSLAPGHADYKARYDGDLRTRDAAYHQGTVWGWLIGPYVDAWLRVHPDDAAGARRLLEGFDRHMGEAGIGSISEIFDAEEPFAPRGCIAQAWSVAEVLRCLRRVV